jgi:hypothetical protein
MSLGIVFKGTEGIVLAADSRVTLMATLPNLAPQNPGVQQVVVVPATFDNASKLLRVKGQDYVGAVTFGAGSIGTGQPRTASSYIPEFESELVNEKQLRVDEFAQKLADFFLRQWTANNMPANPMLSDNMIFFVAGYDSPDAAYGRVFQVSIPSSTKPIELNAGSFGMVWGGQRELVDRLLQGFDPNLPETVQQVLNIPQASRSSTLNDDLRNRFTLPIPWQFLPLQDCVDLSIFLVRSTIELQRWMVGVRGVGGAVDVATITRTKGFEEVQLKKITGESTLPW